ncbi:hypothetical protein ABG768_005104 [Culter alburnus]|uniref:Uncharacterized protein n=1 Tax=Culter alburnus TaxID=194366 RepID=A0AAW1ZS87_CULAL
MGRPGTGTTATRAGVPHTRVSLCHEGGSAVHGARAVPVPLQGATEPGECTGYGARAMAGSVTCVGGVTRPPASEPNHRRKHHRGGRSSKTGRLSLSSRAAQGQPPEGAGP